MKEIKMKQIKIKQIKIHPVRQVVRGGGDVFSQFWQPFRMHRLLFIRQKI